MHPLPIRSMWPIQCGRMQSDWNIVKRGWEAHVLGQAPTKFEDPVEAIQTLRVSFTHIPSDLRLHLGPPLIT